MFRWPEFLDARRIAYVTRGRRATPGNVAIDCPFCGDTTQPLAVRIDDQRWHCYACKQGQGGAGKLVKQLLGCSWTEVEQIVGARKPLMPNDMDAVIDGLTRRPVIVAKSRKLALPADFKLIDERTACLPFVNYLRYERHFTTSQIMRLSDDFGIRYTKSGPYRWRIIFPVEYQGVLTTWTGRSIKHDALVKYKTLSADADKAALEKLPPAVAPIGQYIYRYDALAKAKADTIMIVEGPFDVLNVNIIGEGLLGGVVATCVFTNQASDTQIALLSALLPRFKRRVVLLDEDALAPAMRLESRLHGLGIERLRLPRGIKDPGELTRPALRRLLLN